MMSDSTTPSPRTGPPSLREGGYVIVLLIVVSAMLLTWALWPAVFRLADRPLGDGADPASYGFDLTNLTIDQDDLAAVLLHRDMVPVMNDPAIITAQRALEINEKERGKYLVPSDRVIGVVIKGDARAYPISILNVHEVINDTLGSTPIAVIWHWPSAMTGVYSRAFGGRTLTFGTTGLLVDGALVVYDVAQDGAIGGEQLFLPIESRAISGGETDTSLALTPIPMTLTTWESWQMAYPETTVIDRDLSFAKRYKKANPRTYFLTDDLPFHVTPPPPDTLRPKSSVHIVTSPTTRRVIPEAWIIDAAGDVGSWSHDFDDVAVTFTIEDHRIVSAIATGPAKASITQAAWFAWYARHGDGDVIDPREL